MTKLFNTQRNTSLQNKKLMIELAKKEGVKRIIFNNNGKIVAGTYNPSNNIMYICNDRTKKETLCTFFHELAHHYAVKHNKWKKYHYREYKQIKWDTVFDIENKIDKIANVLWNKYVNLKQWGKYVYAYPRSQRQYIINNFIAKYYV